MSSRPILTMPDSFSQGSIVIGMERATGRSESPFTFEDDTFLWPGERWTIDVRMPPITDRRIAGEFIAFGLKLKGNFGRFLTGDPSAIKPLGTALGTPLVDGSGQQGDTLYTDGWLADQDELFLPGDYIQTGQGETARLYMVVDKASSDSNGKAALRIEPSIVTSPTDNSSIIINKPKGLFSLTSPIFDWNAEPLPKYDLQFQGVSIP
jgi:hypothetical protein